MSSMALVMILYRPTKFQKFAGSVLAFSEINIPFKSHFHLILTGKKFIFSKSNFNRLRLYYTKRKKKKFKRKFISYQEKCKRIFQKLENAESLELQCKIDCHQGTIMDENLENDHNKDAEINYSLINYLQVHDKQNMLELNDNLPKSTITLPNKLNKYWNPVVWYGNSSISTYFPKTYHHRSMHNFSDIQQILIGKIWCQVPGDLLSNPEEYAPNWSINVRSHIFNGGADEDAAMNIDADGDDEDCLTTSPATTPSPSMSSGFPSAPPNSLSSPVPPSNFNSIQVIVSSNRKRKYSQTGFRSQSPLNTHDNRFMRRRRCPCILPTSPLDPTPVSTTSISNPVPTTCSPMSSPLRIQSHSPIPPKRLRLTRGTATIYACSRTHSHKKISMIHTSDKDRKLQKQRRRNVRNHNASQSDNYLSLTDTALVQRLLRSPNVLGDSYAQLLPPITLDRKGIG